MHAMQAFQTLAGDFDLPLTGPKVMGRHQQLQRAALRGLLSKCVAEVFRETAYCRNILLVASEVRRKRYMFRSSFLHSFPRAEGSRTAGVQVSTSAPPKLSPQTLDLCIELAPRLIRQETAAATEPLTCLQSHGRLTACAARQSNSMGRYQTPAARGLSQRIDAA